MLCKLVGTKVKATKFPSEDKATVVLGKSEGEGEGKGEGCV